MTRAVFGCLTTRNEASLQIKQVQVVNVHYRLLFFVTLPSEPSSAVEPFRPHLLPKHRTWCHLSLTASLKLLADLPFASSVEHYTTTSYNTQHATQYVGKKVNTNDQHKCCKLYLQLIGVDVERIRLIDVCDKCQWVARCVKLTWVNVCPLFCSNVGRPLKHCWTNEMSSSELSEENFRHCCQLLVQLSQQLEDGWSWESVTVRSSAMTPRCHLCPVMLLMAASVLGLGFRGRLPEKDWAESGGPWFKPGLGAWRVQLRRRTRRSLWLLPSPAETAARTGQHFFLFFSLFFFFFFSLCIVFWCAFVFSMWFHSDIRRSENIGSNAKLLVLITCDNKKLF